MVIKQRFFFGMLFAIIIAGICFCMLSGSFQIIGTNAQSYHTSVGTITISTIFPNPPSNLTLYHVVPQTNDMAHFSVLNLEDIRPNTTSENDAPIVAPKSIQKYGGVPNDAKMAYVKTEYLEEYNSDTRQTIAKYPVSTNIQYSRTLEGIPVTGDGGFINIELGNDGELLYLNKVWRTVEPAGTEKIIPVSKAIEKLGRGEVLDPLKCICDLNVDHIYIAYWEKGQGVQQEYLDPVWVFSGTTSSGEVINYKVYARDDDNFPHTPVSHVAGIQANSSVDASHTPQSYEQNRFINTPATAGNIS
jgi:hypothetical protein